MASSPRNRIMRVGLIGCGEVAQVVHIPTLGFLSDFFKITYLCDISHQALIHCSKKVMGGIPKMTTSAEELIKAPDVDLVFICSSHESHANHILMSLRWDKPVFVEKPMCMSLRDADTIIDAERKSRGWVMVGYMRRYASAFTQALKEIDGMEKINYARVRDIIGPNPYFVAQSGTFPKSFQVVEDEDILKLDINQLEMLEQGLQKECGIHLTPVTIESWKILNVLGCHDISAMRELLGMPRRCLGANLKYPFWSAILDYGDFTVTYESGIDEIPRFDAHIEIYSPTKTVRIQYDTPYVKGLPTMMYIEENVDGVYLKSEVRIGYEDPFTIEMKELYKALMNGRPPKTTAEDARQDLEIFQMIAKVGFAAYAVRN